MQLQHPIELVTGKVTLNEIAAAITYDNKQKVATARIYGIPQIKPLILWQGDSYTAAGQFTDADVDTRIAELLGANPAAVLADLCTRPAPLIPSARPVISPVA